MSMIAVAMIAGAMIAQFAWQKSIGGNSNGAVARQIAGSWEVR